MSAVRYEVGSAKKARRRGSYRTVPSVRISGRETLLRRRVTGRVGATGAGTLDAEAGDGVGVVAGRGEEAALASHQLARVEAC
jgi:hypothetical protein